MGLSLEIATPHATERGQCFACASVAGEPYESMRKYAALKIGIELFGDEARQCLAFLFTLGDVGLRMRSHRAIQRRLFRTVAQVDRFAFYIQFIVCPNICFY